MRARPSCAGAVVFGAAGSNECPAGSVRIEDKAACRSAALAVGKTPVPGLGRFELNPSSPTVPRGCCLGTVGVYLNPDPVGAGNANAQLLCARVTTGALVTPAADARVYRDTRGLGCAFDNNTNGLNIETRTYIYTYHANGARRRRRAAHCSAVRG